MSNHPYERTSQSDPKPSGLEAVLTEPGQASTLVEELERRGYPVVHVGLDQLRGPWGPATGEFPVPTGEVAVADIGEVSGITLAAQRGALSTLLPVEHRNGRHYLQFPAGAYLPHHRDQPVAEIELTPGLFVVLGRTLAPGRTPARPDQTIMIGNPDPIRNGVISAEHDGVYFDGEHLFVEDLRSTHGTGVLVVDPSRRGQPAVTYYAPDFIQRDQRQTP